MGSAPGAVSSLFLLPRMGELTGWTSLFDTERSYPVSPSPLVGEDWGEGDLSFPESRSPLTPDPSPTRGEGSKWVGSHRLLHEAPALFLPLPWWERVGVTGISLLRPLGPHIS